MICTFQSSPTSYIIKQSTRKSSSLIVQYVSKRLFMGKGFENYANATIVFMFTALTNGFCPTVLALFVEVRSLFLIIISSNISEFILSTVSFPTRFLPFSVFSSENVVVETYMIYIDPFARLFFYYDLLPLQILSTPSSSNVEYFRVGRTVVRSNLR